MTHSPSSPATEQLRELAQQLLDAAHYSTELSRLEGHCRDIAHKIECLAEGSDDAAATPSMPQAAQELAAKHDWCPACHRGWSWVDPRSAPRAAEPLASVYSPSTPVTVTVFASGDGENTPAEAVHHALAYAHKAGFIDGWSDPHCTYPSCECRGGAGADGTLKSRCSRVGGGSGPNDPAQASTDDPYITDLKFANEQNIKAARKYKARLDFMEAKYGAIDWDAAVPSTHNPCPGCDGHECDDGCRYPGAQSSPDRGDT